MPEPLTDRRPEGPLREATVETLRPICLGVAALFLGLAALNACMQVRGPWDYLVLHDFAVLGLALVVWSELGRPQAPARVYALAFVLGLVVESNSLLAFWLHHSPLEVDFLALTLMAAGMIVLSTRTMAALVAFGITGWLLVARPSLGGTEATRSAFLLGSGALVGVGMHLSRLRHVLREAGMRRADAQQRKALEGALQVAQASGRELDRRVEARTMELARANERLKSELDQRSRLEAERSTLAQQLQQSQKLEAIGRLAGGVAHDFNNILTVIQGSLQLALLDPPSDPDLRSLLEDAQKASARAASLTRQLLAFSRRQVLSPRAMDLREVLRGIGRIVARAAGERIRVHLDDQTPVLLVRIDPGQIEQVLMNLVLNACDAMPSGGELWIELSDVDATPEAPVVGVPAGRWVRVTVRDTGVGMSEQTVARIFEPFFTTKAVGKGTGLGLAMVDGIVAQHGGQVVVRSRLGEGTRIEVYLPVTDLPQAGRTPVVTLTTPRRATLLLVEDEHAVRSLAARALEHKGLWVVTAASGEEALSKRALLPQIDLLVTDVVMPGIDGPTLARQLRLEKPSLRVIFASGYSDERLKDINTDSNDRFLPKPYTPAQLLAAVTEVLDSPAV